MESSIKGLTSFAQSLTIITPQKGRSVGRQHYDRDVSVYTETETIAFHDKFRDELFELARLQNNDPTLYASVLWIEVPKGQGYVGRDGSVLVPKKPRVEGVEGLTMLFVILNYEQANLFTERFNLECYKLNYSPGASTSGKDAISTCIEEGKGNFSIKNNKSLILGSDDKSRSVVSFFNPPTVDVEKYEKDDEGYTIFENGEPKVFKVAGRADIYLSSIGFVDLSCIFEDIERGEGEDEYLSAFAVSVQKFANPGNPGRIKKRKDSGKEEESDDSDESDE